MLEAIADSHFDYLFADCISACIAIVGIEKSAMGQTKCSSWAKCVHKLLQVHAISHNFSQCGCCY